MMIEGFSYKVKCDSQKCSKDVMVLVKRHSSEQRQVARMAILKAGWAVNPANKKWLCPECFKNKQPIIINPGNDSIISCDSLSLPVKMN